MAYTIFDYTYDNTDGDETTKEAAAWDAYFKENSNTRDTNYFKPFLGEAWNNNFTNKEDQNGLNNVQKKFEKMKQTEELFNNTSDNTQEKKWAEELFNNSKEDYNDFYKKATEKYDFLDWLNEDPNKLQSQIVDKTYKWSDLYQKPISPYLAKVPNGNLKDYNGAPIWLDNQITSDYAPRNTSLAEVKSMGEAFNRLLETENFEPQYYDIKNTLPEDLFDWDIFPNNPFSSLANWEDRTNNSRMNQQNSYQDILKNLYDEYKKQYPTPRITGLA